MPRFSIVLALVLPPLLFSLSACDNGTSPSPVVTAALTVAPASGDTDTGFTFNAGGSSSTGKAPSMEYRWDWESDGTFDESWSASPSATHLFPVPGSYSTTVEVRDGQVTDQASASVTVAPAVEALLEVSPQEGTMLTDFAFDASGSTTSSPGAGNLEYRWDFYNDGSWDTQWSSEPTITRRFDTGDSPQTKVEVRDGDGLADAMAQVELNLNHGASIDSLLVQDQDIQAYGLAFDGEHFWVSQWGPDETLVKVSFETGETLVSFPAHSNWTGGLAWDGAHLWQVSWLGESVLIQIDPSDGTVLQSFPVIYSRSSSGLCWNGEAFYYGSWEKEGTGGDDRIHKYDVTGAELTAFDTPEGTTHPEGLACDGETLWVIAGGTQNTYQVDPATGAVIREMVRPSGRKITIAKDYLWQFGTTSGKPVIYKIVP